jgi:hypothetical protein
MHAFLRPAALVAALVAVAGPGHGRAAGAPQRADPALATVLERVGAWIETFERSFSSVVAEERYVQLLKPWFGVPRSPKDESELQWRDEVGTTLPNRPNAPLRRRQLRSDVLLVQVPGQPWLSYRDVFEVDGRPVRNREDRVKRLFLSERADDKAQLRRIADESARYNIGGLIRNFNIPTFPLIAAQPRHQGRFRFARREDEAIDGVARAVVEFREEDSPAIVRTPNGQDVPIAGRLWADPETGRVVRARVEIDNRWANLRSVIETTYVDHAELGVVPGSMWEWYRTTQPTLTGSERAFDTYVECLAGYDNFRRFTVETTQIIK